MRRCTFIDERRMNYGFIIRYYFSINNYNYIYSINWNIN